MKLSNLESGKLLPRFAAGSKWACDALDVLVKRVNDRATCIPAPLSMDAIKALNDEELQAYYDQFGLVEYYPDLSRYSRERMLYEASKIWRYLGTPNAILELCRYLFDNIPFSLDLRDNLAFDDEGELVDEELLNLFDVFVDIHAPRLSKYIFSRIMENVFRFCRNSQTLRNITIDFTGEVLQNVSLCGNINAVRIIEADRVAEKPVMTLIVLDEDGNIISGASEKAQTIPLETVTLQEEPIESIPLQTMTVTEPLPVIIENPPVESIDVLMGRKWNGTQFVAQTSSANNWCWACVMSLEWKETIEAFGLTVGYTDSSNSPYGFIMWNNNYTFECIGVYSDINGETAIQTDLTKIECIDADFSGYYERGILAPRTKAKISTPIMTWKFRITKNS